MANSADTLMHVFDSGALDWPGHGGLVWLNAHLPALSPIAPERASAMTCRQTSRATSRALQAAGLATSPDIIAGPDDADRPALVLVCAGQHRDENRLDLVTAQRLCAPGGHVVVAGAKTQGIASLRKWVAEHHNLEGSLSKHHGQAFWFRTGPVATLPEPPGLARQDYGALAAPGMFSHDHVDAGSALLARHLAAHARGHVADFGCGWGFLALALVQLPAVKGLACFEDHWPSLMAAKANLEETGTQVPLSFDWTDLESESVEKGFDTVVMNPPFHSGGAQRRSLGEAFIRSAAGALKPGGQLLMVANSGLSYEPVLSSAFKRWQILEQANGFKVLQASR